MAEGKPRPGSEPRRRVLGVIAHFIDGYGGTPESLLLLAWNLAREEDVFVDVTSAEGFWPDVHELSALPAKPDGTRSRPDVSDYDAVFIAGSWNPAALGLAIRARLASIPVTYAAKGNLCRVDFGRLRDLKKWPYLVGVESLVVRAANTIVFSSETERDDWVLPASFWKGKSAILAEPFEGPELPPRSPRAPDPAAPIFGFLAEISPRKGLQELVDGFLAWLDSGGSGSLWIAGAPRPGSEGYEREIQDRIAASPHASSFRWLGARRGPERMQFYDEIDVFVCPSIFESFGLTPLEALWSGKPVIAGSRLGVLEHLAPEAVAHRLPTLSAPDVARGLDAVFRGFDTHRTAALALRGRRLEAFSGPVLARRFAEVLCGRGDASAAGVAAARTGETCS